MKNRFLKFKKLLISAAAFCIAAMPLSAGMAVGAVKYIDEPKASATLSYEKEDTAGATVNKAESYAELEGEPAQRQCAHIYSYNLPCYNIERRLGAFLCQKGKNLILKINCSLLLPFNRAKGMTVG